MRLKILGERNTGTNWLERMLTNAMPSVDIVHGNLPAPYQAAFRSIKLVAGERRARPIVESLRDRAFEKHFDRTLGWKHASARAISDNLDRASGEVVVVAMTKNPYSWLMSLHRRPYSVDHQEERRSASLSEFVATSWPTVGREYGPDHYQGPVEMLSLIHI